MSFVAEFADEIFAEYKEDIQEQPETIQPLTYPAASEKLYDVRALILDIYGTVINYWRPGFDDSQQKMQILLQAFSKTSQYFGFEDYLVKMNPNDRPEQTLYDFYHGLIALNHEKKLQKGMSFPEVRIEEIWEIIIMMLGRHGYETTRLNAPSVQDLARCAAFYYNFFSLGHRLYDGVVDALCKIKDDNIVLGIVSNAQFYTPIELTLLFRQQSKEKIVDYQELFNIDLTFFSYEIGVAKPNNMLFEKLYDALYALHILPSQTVFVGNDLSQDILPASQAGMKTAFFTADQRCAYVHDLQGKVIPDITVESWHAVPQKISFFEDKKNGTSL